MALVTYSDSSRASSVSDHDNPPKNDKQDADGSRKRKHGQIANSSMPPLPDSFHHLYASPARISKQDDPALHHGRQRSTPHVEGTWPTHVYLEWHPSQEQLSRLDGLLTNLGSDGASKDSVIASLLRSDLGASQPLHISLSRPLALTTGEREPFRDALSSAISRSGIRPFQLSTQGFNWVSNEEKTRWFLVLRVQKPPKNELNKLLDISNRMARHWHKLPLYDDPRPHQTRKPRSHKQPRSMTQNRQERATVLHPTPAVPDSPDVTSHFHVSIGWKLDPPSRDSVAELNRSIAESDSAFTISIDSIQVKIGNAIITIPLPTAAEAQHRLFGL